MAKAPVCQKKDTLYQLGIRDSGRPRVHCYTCQAHMELLVEHRWDSCVRWDRCNLVVHQPAEHYGYHWYTHICMKTEL